MVFEEKHRDSILIEAKCIPPPQPDPTTLGQQELGASLGTGMVHHQAQWGPSAAL